MRVFKNPLWEITGLLILTGIVLSIYAFSSKEIKLGNQQIEKSGMKAFFTSSENTTAEFISLPKSMEPAKAKQEPDTASQRILFIGDSMLEGLMHKAKEYTDYNGHELFPVIWYSSSTLWYGQYDTLSYFIRKFKPTYIMVVLGANELFISNIFEKRNKYVKHILEQIDTIPFVWIGPPNWKDDTGINDMIIANVGTARYFESKKLSYKRAKDGAHPVRSSSDMWMDSIASWVMNQSMHPIILRKPVGISPRYPGPTLLQPIY
jgi:hypothetical protein